MNKPICIGILDYDAGNISSVANALNHLTVNNLIVKSPEQLVQLDGLIIPGVGSFDDAMASLENRKFIPALESIRKTIPILGICLGMQILCRQSEEGQRPGLGWIDGTVNEIKNSSGLPDFKTPHMGWNEVYGLFSPLFHDIPENTDFYFVHSYCVHTKAKNLTYAQTKHGEEFVSAFQHENLFGVQFHPEKSQDFGLKLLSNFTEVCRG